MTTPHEDVTSVIKDVQEYDMATLEPPISHPEDLATAAIETLRAGAVERIHDALDLTGGSYTMETIIDAILGPPNEVSE